MMSASVAQITPFDHPMFALRTLRELKLLKYFQEQNVSENVRNDLIEPGAVPLNARSRRSFRSSTLSSQRRSTPLSRST